MVDPDRELMRTVVGAGAGDAVFVEHDDIREHAETQYPEVTDFEPLCSE